MDGNWSRYERGVFLVLLFYSHIANVAAAAAVSFLYVTYQYLSQEVSVRSLHLVLSLR